jgi:hypothetical protein
MSLPLLSLTIFVPLLGALAILLSPKPDSARWIALPSTQPSPDSNWSRNMTGWAAAFPTIWAWTAFPCCSWS